MKKIVFILFLSFISIINVSASTYYGWEHESVSELPDSSISTMNKIYDYDNKYYVTVSHDDIPVGYVDSHIMLLLQGNDFTDSSTYHRSFTNMSTVIGTSGKFGNCYDMSVASRYMYVPMSTILSNQSNWTIEGWYKLPTFTTARHLMELYTSSSDRILYETATGNKIFSSGMQSSSTFSLNTWFHFAVVNNNNWLSMYINGVKQSYLFAYTPKTNLYIGAGISAPGTYNWRGYIDEFIVSDFPKYSSNFTPLEIEYSPDGTIVTTYSWLEISYYDWYEISDTEDVDFYLFYNFTEITGFDIFGWVDFDTFTDFQKLVIVLGVNTFFLGFLGLCIYIILRSIFKLFSMLF